MALATLAVLLHGVLHIDRPVEQVLVVERLNGRIRCLKRIKRHKSKVSRLSRSFLARDLQDGIPYQS